MICSTIIPIACGIHDTHDTRLKRILYKNQNQTIQSLSFLIIFPLYHSPIPSRASLLTATSRISSISNGRAFCMPWI